jgi:CheY-like chemotaxis protein
MGCLLLIDDNATDRFLMKRALMTKNDTLELFELNNGYEAVKVIKDKKPLATMLDIRMPGMDGYEVLKLIREDRTLKNHLVLMISGSKEPADVQMAYAAGANAYLPKPSTMTGYNQLADMIHDHVFP